MSTGSSFVNYCRVALLVYTILPLAQGFSPCAHVGNSLAGCQRPTLVPRTVLFSDVSEAAATEGSVIQEDEKEEAAAKQPNRVTKRERHTLFVGNLDFETKDEDIRDLFSQSGTVELVSIPVNKETGKARGFAFVDMSSAEECDKAIESFAGSSFNGRVLRVTKSLPKREAKKQVFSKGDEGGQKLYVGNLPFDVTKADLIGLFEKYGTVKDCFLPTDRETGEFRGFAFVTLDDEEAAEKAIEATNGMEFLGRPLVVNKPLPPGEKKVRKNNRSSRQKLYIGNLSFYTVPETLRELFAEFGEVHDCYMPEDPETGGSRGFGFVTLDKEAAEAAIRATDGLELDGRIIRVNSAQPKESVQNRNNDGDWSGDNDYEP